jgi:uncharacterized RDD family membrane protein YckC
MQSYHIAQNGQQIGIFPESQILTGLQSGQFSGTDLFWTEGMATWQALNTKFQVAPPAPAPSANPNPYASPASSANPNPYAAPTILVAPLPTLPLASIGSRFAAQLIDGILGVLVAIPFFAAVPLLEQTEDSAATTTGLLLFGLGVVLFLVLIGINIFLLATRGKTIGKLWMHIRIVSYPQGQHPDPVKTILLRSFVNALLTNFVPFYAIIDPCFIFNQNRRCVHDLLAETTVVRDDTPS